MASTDKLRKSAPRFSTTLNGAYNGTDPTIPLTTTSGLPPDTAVDITLVEYNADGDVTAYATYVGDVSGDNIANADLVEGTERAWASGTVVLNPLTSDNHNDEVDWALTQHNQDGSHAAVTATSLSVSGATSLSGGLTVTGSLSLPAGSVETADLADDSITSAKLNPTKSTDANGWTVYDYGNWKEYAKVFAFSATIGAGSTGFVTSGANYPVGITFNDVHHTVTLQRIGNAASMLANIEVSSGTATSFSLVARNFDGSASAGNGNVFVQLKSR